MALRLDVALNFMSCSSHPMEALSRRSAHISDKSYISFPLSWLYRREERQYKKDIKFGKDYLEEGKVMHQRELVRRSDFRGQTFRENFNFPCKKGYFCARGKCVHAQLHLCEHPTLAGMGLHLCSPAAGMAQFLMGRGPGVGDPWFK